MEETSDGAADNAAGVTCEGAHWSLEPRDSASHVVYVTEQVTHLCAQRAGQTSGCHTHSPRSLGGLGSKAVASRELPPAEFGAVSRKTVDTSLNRPRGPPALERQACGWPSPQRAARSCRLAAIFPKPRH